MTNKTATAETKQTIGGLMLNLSLVKGELDTYRGSRDAQIARLAAVGKAAAAGSLSDVEWPSTTEHRRLLVEIESLEREAHAIVKQLRDLGIKPDIFDLGLT